MARIPGLNKRWAGTFPGNFFGEVWSTRNIDLDRVIGRAILADRMKVHTDDQDTNMSNLGNVTKFIRTNADVTDRWWALCSSGTTGGRLFKSVDTSPVSAWAEDALANTITDALDMETHESANGEQRLLVTRAGDIAILNKSGGANAWDNDWGSTVASLTLTNTSGTLHPIARLQRLIGIGDGNLFHTIDKNDVASASRLVFPYGYSTRCIYATSDRFWIGLKGDFGQPARVIEWDGSALSYLSEPELPGTTPLAGFIINNVPYFITERGYIMKYSGGSFQEVQRFPFADERRTITATDLYPHGVTVDRSLAYINLRIDEASLNATASLRARSGIWVFNADNRSLYHQRSLTASNVDAESTNPDFGQSPPATVGVLKLINIDNAVSTPILMAGGTYYSAYTGTTREAIFRSVPNFGSTAQSSSRGYNVGHLVTPYLPSAEVDEMWEGVWLKFKRFISSSNRIVLKARATDEKPNQDISLTGLQAVQASGTWASTTTFTCAVPTGVAVGDEVEVLTGNGGGCTFHITTLSGTPDGSTSITVTVDEALPSLNAGGSRGAYFRFDNWVKVGTITSTTVGNQPLRLPQTVHGEFIQLKIELRGYEVELDEIIPVSKPKTLVKSM